MNPSTRILSTVTNTTDSASTDTPSTGTDIEVGQSTVRLREAAVLAGTPSAIRMMVSSQDRCVRNMSSYNYHQYWNRFAEDDNNRWEAGIYYKRYNSDTLHLGPKQYNTCITTGVGLRCV